MFTYGFLKKIYNSMIQTRINEQLENNKINDCWDKCLVASLFSLYKRDIIWILIFESSERKKKSKKKN